MAEVRQPEVNIGMIGHVDHGKTTLTKALSGEWTDRHSEEVKRGISIRLGYADVSFYKCPKCEGSSAYTTQPNCEHCGGGDADFQRAVSFVDAPGHETLMATMLSGAAIMNGALLLVAANEKCPQPQTKEHLMALTIIGVDKIVIVQNKIDIVTKEEALENYKEIKEFVKGTIAENAPVIPVSANHNVNIDKLIETIQATIPTPKQDLKKPARMFVARSFDINTPGSPVASLRGGVLGGSLMQGKLEVGDEIEIAPGRKVEMGREVTWEKITTTIESLHAGDAELDVAKPGGLIAIGTKLDPCHDEVGRTDGKGRRQARNAPASAAQVHHDHQAPGARGRGGGRPGGREHQDERAADAERRHGDHGRSRHERPRGRVRGRAQDPGLRREEPARGRLPQDPGKVAPDRLRDNQVSASCRRSSSTRTLS